MCKIGGSNTTSSNDVDAVADSSCLTFKSFVPIMGDEQQQQPIIPTTLSPEPWTGGRYCDLEPEALYPHHEPTNHHHMSVTTATATAIAGGHHSFGEAHFDNVLPLEPQPLHLHHATQQRDHSPPSSSSSPLPVDTPTACSITQHPPPTLLRLPPPAASIPTLSYPSTQQPPPHLPLQQSRRFLWGTADCERFSLTSGDAATCRHVQVVEDPAQQNVVVLQCASCRGDPQRAASFTVPRSVRTLAQCLRYLAKEHLWRCEHVSVHARDVIWQSLLMRQQSQEQWQEEVALNNLIDYCHVRARQLQLADKYPGDAGMVFCATSHATMISSSTGSTTPRTSTLSPAPHHPMHQGAAVVEQHSAASAFSALPQQVPQQLSNTSLSMTQQPYLGIQQQTQQQQVSHSSPHRSQQFGPRMVLMNASPSQQQQQYSRSLMENHHRRHPSQTSVENRHHPSQASAVFPTVSGNHPQDSPPLMIVAPYGDSSSSYSIDNNFSFFQQASGEWICRYCESLPPQYRDYGYQWPPAGSSSRGPPPADFVEHHIRQCRMHHRQTLRTTNHSMTTNVVLQQHQQQQAMMVSSSSSPPLVTPQPPHHHSSYHPAASQQPSTTAAVQHPDGLHLVLPPPGATPHNSSSNHAQVSDDQQFRWALAHLERLDSESWTPSEQPIVKPDDRLLITDFVYFLMGQFRKCQLTESDRISRGRKRENMQEGYGGFQCRHCADLQTARKYYWTAVDRLSNSFAEVTHHALRCKASPPKTRQALSILRERHKEQMSRLPRGSQKVYFRRMWKRIHPDGSIGSNSTAMDEEEEDTLGDSASCASPNGSNTLMDL